MSHSKLHQARKAPTAIARCCRDAYRCGHATMRDRAGDLCWTRTDNIRLSSIARPLAYLGRHGTVAVALAVFIGLIFQPIAALLKPLLVPSILLPFIVSLLHLRWRDLKRSLSPGLLMPLLFWLLCGEAVLVWALLWFIPGSQPIDSYLIATAACAPLMASSAIAMLLGLEVGLAVAATVAATLLLPVTMPAAAHYLAQIELDLVPLEIGLRLAALVAVSIAVASVVRFFAGAPRLARNRDVLAGLSVIGLAGFAIAVMDGALALFAQRPAFVAACALGALALNAGLQALGACLFWPFIDTQRALTIGLIAGNNNIGILLASSVDHAPVTLTVFVAMAQFPIYLLPVMQRRFYRRWLDGAATSGEDRA